VEWGFVGFMLLINWIDVDEKLQEDSKRGMELPKGKLSRKCGLVLRREGKEEVIEYDM